VAPGVGRLARLGLLVVVVFFAAAGDGLGTFPFLGPAAALANGHPSSEPWRAVGTLTSSWADNTPGSSFTVDEAEPVAGSEPEIRFQRISLEQGLSQSSVLSILQDRQGLMWFGTLDGLNRYDSYEFKVYRHDPADPHSPDPGSIGLILEDQVGMLWIVAGSSYLNRYDRDLDRFTRYRLVSDDAEGGTDLIWTVYEDSGGTVWVGTYRNGLHRYDRQADQFIQYRHHPDDVHSLSDDRVYAIYEDHQGALWIGTKSGLNRLDRETDRFTAYRHDPDDPGSLGSDIVQLVFEDQAGRLWVTTYPVGLEQFDREAGRVIARYQHDPNNPQSIDRTDRITDVHVDSRGLLWIQHFDGRLDRFDPETGIFRRYRHDPDDPHSLSQGEVSFVVEDKAGTLWVGTTGGLDRYDSAADQFIHYRNNPRERDSLSSNDVMSFFEDRASVLWIGTWSKGLNLYAPYKEKFRHYQLDPDALDSVQNNVVNSIYRDRTGTLWIGTDAGLNRLDPKTGELTRYVHDPEDPRSLSLGWVGSIYEDTAGRLWIGTQGGLNRLDRQTGRFTRYQVVPSGEYTLGIGTIRSIYQDGSGVIWLAKHRQGLCEFDPQTDECVQYLYAPEDALSPHNMATTVYEDSAGTLWIGTQGGLHEFDRDTKMFTAYEHDPKDPQSLSGSYVAAIYEDRTGTLWVGTNRGGLNRFDRETKTFTRYSERDGLPSSAALGILEDTQGHLWLSTNKGLSEFDPRAETFRNYDSSDGLQSNEFIGGAYHRTADGAMLFGGVNGFNIFWPEEIQDNPTIPPVVLTSLTQGGEAVVVGKAVESVTDVTFEWPNNFFEFEFAALDFTQPDRNQYAYMLEGFRDESWNYIGTRRFGKYTNLPGGTYTLRLRGSNSDGVWNEDGLSITVTIVPPFWDTWWFRGIVAAVLLACVVGGYRLRVRSVEARSRELEEQVQQRTAELRQEMEQRERIEEALRQSEAQQAVAAERSRLARDLHDAVTQTLFSASLLAEALPALWESDQGEGRRLLSELRQLSRGALAEMRTLLLELRPAALVETSLSDLLQQLGEAATGRMGVPVTLAVDGRCMLPSDVHVALYRIAQEALNNVVKHARASRVCVSLHCASSSAQIDSEQRQRVELQVADDGRGFDAAHVPPDRMGLGIIRERAQAIGATLDIDSQPGCGTRIVIVWPGAQGEELL
jgi:ligand-binding sensor domain-containing protein/signal transduction histidine kinase